MLANQDALVAKLLSQQCLFECFREDSGHVVRGQALVAENEAKPQTGGSLVYRRMHLVFKEKWIPASGRWFCSMDLTTCIAKELGFFQVPTPGELPEQS